MVSSVVSSLLESDLVEFDSVPEPDVEKLIKLSSSKSCALPTWMVKQCLPVLLPFITNIVNLSLLTSTVPNQFKSAVITPIRKKSSLDPIVLKNFRPVANLPFISKVVEKAVALQISTHFEKNDLNVIYQSAYKKCYSTERALLRVQNDLLMALDSCCSVILLMLDLSAAFDTIDHSPMLYTLANRFTTKAKVLHWFETYLSQSCSCKL